MFQYRIFPTKKQAKLLEKQLEECRWLYNHLLEKRRDAYEQTGKGLTCYEQQATYPILKQEHPSLNAVHSQVLQNVAVRIDLAFKAFFRRCKAGEPPGYCLVDLCRASSPSCSSMPARSTTLTTRSAEPATGELGTWRFTCSPRAFRRPITVTFLACRAPRSTSISRGAVSSPSLTRQLKNASLQTQGRSRRRTG